MMREEIYLWPCFISRVVEGKNSKGKILLSFNVGNKNKINTFM